MGGGGGRPAAARQPHFGSALANEEPNRIYFLSPFTPDDGSRMNFRIVVIDCNTRKNSKSKLAICLTYNKIFKIHGSISLNFLSVGKCIAIGYTKIFLALSYSHEQNLLASSCPSVRPSVSAPIPLHGFP